MAIVRTELPPNLSRDRLCEIAAILKDEVIKTVRAAGASCCAIEPLVERLLQDAQERLIFRFQTFIRDTISSFAASPAELRAALAHQTEQQRNSATHGLSSRWYPTVQHALMGLSKVRGARIRVLR